VPGAAAVAGLLRGWRTGGWRKRQRARSTAGGQAF